MKAVLQRVTRASVTSRGELLGRIDQGLVVLLGILRGDGQRQAERLAERIAHLRCFENEAGRMDASALERGLALLVVSQFTLAADGRKGRRPSFDRAAPPAEAEPLYESFVAHLRGLGLRVETGRFRAPMEVELVGDGPVTFVLDDGPDFA